MKYKCFECYAGNKAPQLHLQITPFSWGLGAGFGGGKVALRVGPIAIAIWYRFWVWEIRWNNDG